MISTQSRTKRAASALEPPTSFTSFQPAGVQAKRARLMQAKGIAVSTALLLMTTLLTACGGPNLKPEQPAGVSLAGAWHLDRAASDDPQALIARLQEKFMKRLRGGPGEGPEGFDGLGGLGSEDGGARDAEADQRGPTGATEPRPSGGGVGASASRGRGGRGGFLVQRYGQALGARLSGGDGLVIEQSATGFVIIRGDARYSYTPGGHSVVSVPDGVADQRSGWKGREYVIDVRPQVGAHLSERYGLTADGRLVEKVSLSEDGLPKLEFTRVYDAGPAPARALPTSN